MTTISVTSPRCCSCKATPRPSPHRSRSRIRRARISPIRAAPPTSSPVSCGRRSPASATICAFRTTGCSGRSACAAPCSQPDASGTFIGCLVPLCLGARLGAARPAVPARRGVAAGSGCCRRAGSPIRSSRRRNRPQDDYGAQVWLKLPESPGLGEPPMPEDAYYMLGYRRAGGGDRALARSRHRAARADA